MSIALLSVAIGSPLGYLLGRWLTRRINAQLAEARFWQHLHTIETQKMFDAIRKSDFAAVERANAYADLYFRRAMEALNREHRRKPIAKARALLAEGREMGGEGR